jgi:hypothetical protein
MSLTYKQSPDVNRNNVEEVRFLIQDTEESTHLLEDEEIQYLIDTYLSTSNISSVCAAACEVMATKYARKQELSVSNYNQKFDSIYKKLLERAKDFRFNSITTAHLFAPSVSKTSKSAQRSDTDNVTPSFGRGMLDNPEAPNNPFSVEVEEDTVD